MWKFWKFGSPDSQILSPTKNLQRVSTFLVGQSIQFTFLCSENYLNLHENLLEIYLNLPMSICCTGRYGPVFIYFIYFVVFAVVFCIFVLIYSVMWFTYFFVYTFFWLNPSDWLIFWHVMFLFNFIWFNSLPLYKYKLLAQGRESATAQVNYCGPFNNNKHNDNI